MKKVLLIVVDALATRVVEPAMRQGRLPNLAKLAEAGVMLPRCISVFPSVTPAATASLATGKYPCDHEIAGIFWYDVRQDRVAYYANDFWAIVNRGPGQFLRDFVVSLNFERLKADTLFETVERQGLRSACINFMWIRGDQPHDLDVPWLLKLIPGADFPERIFGPHTLLLADFLAESREVREVSGSRGVTNRFGFNDDSTSEYLLQFARHEKLADFTVAYFPDNDFDSHEHGAAGALLSLEKVDTTLGRLFDIWGGYREMLRSLAVIVAGDHSQSDLHEDEAARSIRLEEIFEGFRFPEAGKPWGSEDELMLCPNMRAAQVYLRRKSSIRREQVAARLLAEGRVDQVLWDNRQETTEQGAPRHWWVATSDRGELEFWLATDETDHLVDRHGNRWCCRGDLAAVDATAGDGEICYGIYPNALERIASGPGDVGGDVWATARLGSEFCLPKTGISQRGSHGSLHEADSVSPLFLAGLPGDVSVPSAPRTVDVAAICLSTLGLRQVAPPTGTK